MFLKLLFASRNYDLYSIPIGHWDRARPNKGKPYACLTFFSRRKTKWKARNEGENHKKPSKETIDAKDIKMAIRTV